jgi:hypothetical protein
MLVWNREEKERILPRIRIVFHAVPTFPRGTSQYQRLLLLRCRRRNQRAEEV